MAMFSANMDLNGTSVAGSAVNVPEFPSEEPETRDFNEWIDCAGPVLQRAGHGPAMRGEMPPGLHQLSFQMGMPELSKLSDDERAKVGPVEAAKHDLLVAENSRKKAAAQMAYDSTIREFNNKLAANLDVAMRKTAPLRLKALLTKHEDATVSGVYDGGAMWRELVAHKNSASRVDDKRTHSRVVEAAREITPTCRRSTRSSLTTWTTWRIRTRAMRRASGSSHSHGQQEKKKKVRLLPR